MIEDGLKNVASEGSTSGFGEGTSQDITEESVVFGSSLSEEPEEIEVERDEQRSGGNVSGLGISDGPYEAEYSGSEAGRSEGEETGKGGSNDEEAAYSGSSFVYSGSFEAKQNSEISNNASTELTGYSSSNLVYGSVSDDTSIKGDVSDYTNYFVVAIFGLGCIAGILFGKLASWR